MKNIQYRLEAWLMRVLLHGFRLLPLDIASAAGGIVMRIIGPFFSAHRTALKNIGAAFPALSEKDIVRLAGRMWENLGRTGAEYASIPGTRLTSRVEVIGAENLPAPGKPVLFFSGHMGNWEMLYPIAYDRGTQIAIVYRHANNPYVDQMIAGLRKSHCSELIPKGLRGGVKILSALKRGVSVALLVDQKQNNGIPVPFFGRDAMTSPAIAEIALKYDIPVIPTRVVRTKGAHFKGYLYPPLSVQKSGDHKADVLAFMTQINAMLESWIRECPEQWFWVHRRWPKA